ncbi:hypothetical protein D3G25_07735 [Salmonella enterica subsp. enterica serovar Braenderup]|nr:hypothetical protein [Salmonella enterica]ECD0156092.1 hypothetical protein [Salmonella enterica subsp. enterica]ECH7917308.1 hypothetical protein [Salmonella enterica subsp. enterica]ECT3490063.1 hypothetical protein [Salmonella enterica subsp. enterica serovar Braenderup]
MCSPAKATPRLGWRGKSTIKKIVHYRADLCGDFAAGVFTSKQAKLQPVLYTVFVLFEVDSLPLVHTNLQRQDVKKELTEKGTPARKRSFTSQGRGKAIKQQVKSINTTLKA